MGRTFRVAVAVRRAVQLGERASADPTLASEVEAMHEYLGSLAARYRREPDNPAMPRLSACFELKRLVVKVPTPSAG